MRTAQWLRSCCGLAILSLAAPLFGQFVYAGTTAVPSPWGYAIDESTGALTPISGLPNFSLPVPGSPINFTVDCTGRFLYVGMAGPDSKRSDYGRPAAAGTLGRALATRRSRRPCTRPGFFGPGAAKPDQARISWP